MEPELRVRGTLTDHKKPRISIDMDILGKGYHVVVEVAT